MDRPLALLLSAACLAPVASAQDLLYRLPGMTALGGPDLRSVGDFDGDGREDLGISGLLTPLSPNLVVVSGRDGTRLIELYDNALRMGDLDGDGTIEVVHALAAYSSAPVRVRDLAGNLRFTIPVPEGSRSFGLVNEIIGDWDGDGTRDLAIGAPSDTYVFEGLYRSVGRVFVHSGADGRRLAMIRPPSAFTTGFGAQIDPIGDVDGDGVDDLVIGRRGDVGIYAGGSGALLHQVGTAEYAVFGNAVSVTADADGDGVEDVIVGGHDGFARGGYASLCSGRDGHEIRRFTDVVTSFFGVSVTGLGDVDGDGRGDVAVGGVQRVSWHGGATTGPGFVRVFSGGTGDEIFTTSGAALAQGFGFTIGAAGDMNGDGAADLAVSSMTGPEIDVFSTRPLMLAADRHVVDVAVGGATNLSLRDPALAGMFYVLLGTASDIEPGFVLGGTHIPLNMDAYLMASAAFANSGIFGSTLGAFDAGGAANATITLPALPGAAGVRLDHAWVAFDGAGKVRGVSNAAPLTLR